MLAAPAFVTFTLILRRPSVHALPKIGARLSGAVVQVFEAGCSGPTFRAGAREGVTEVFARAVDAVSGWEWPSCYNDTFLTDEIDEFQVCLRFAGDHVEI